MPRAGVFAQCTIPASKSAPPNEHVVLVDSQRISIGSHVFELDEVFVPMSLRAMFKESGLARALTLPVLRGRDVAVVYYGEDAAGKDSGEFLFQCSRGLFAEPTQVQLSAHGFYRDRRVALQTADVVAKSVGGLRELLARALPRHSRRARKARGRSHAVFRFEAAGTLTVYLVDGLANGLRQPNRDYRLTTAADNAASAIDRPGIPQRLLRTIAADIGPGTPVFVFVHCPLAAKHRYALADSLRFAREWRACERLGRRSGCLSSRGPGQRAALWSEPDAAHCAEGASP